MKFNVVKNVIMLSSLTMFPLMAQASGKWSPPSSFFNNASSSTVTPKDGVWKPKILSNNVQGCPPMMQSMISQSEMKEVSKKIKFSKPFHPSSLFDGSSKLEWKQTEPNVWETVITEKGEEGTSVKMKWAVSLLSDKKMLVWSRTNMQFPAQMAAMMGGSSECSIQANGEYNYIGQ